ncbi:MAG: hypothetical protein KDH09_15210, partial [Chrysiogenetes bacterium]|nr:hypothetical protein [Chrysiogenetes bacterium]
AFKRWEQARSRNKLSHADLLATCLAALEWQEKLPEWQDANGKYIPGIEPWLNQDKFLADPPLALATKPNRPPEYRAERPRPGGGQ